MKQIRKIVSTLLAIVFMLTCVVGLNTMEEVKAADSTTVVIHYFRWDGSYAPWNVWLWNLEPVKADGAACQFNGEDKYGKILTVTIPSKVTKAGFIVRKGEWEDKDTPNDRTIDNINGKKEVWLIQGDVNVYDKQPVILPTMKAYLDSKRTVNVVLQQKVKLTGKGAEGFRVLTSGQDDAPIAIKSVKSAIAGTNETTAVTITTNEDLDPANYYEVAYKGYKNSGIQSRKILDTNDYYYSKDDLGATYTKKSTTFKIWAPTAGEVDLKLYQKPHKSTSDKVADPYKKYYLERGAKGVWSITINGDLNGKYYLYEITHIVTAEASKTVTVADPYSHATSANSERTLIYDPAKVNAAVAKWSSDKGPKLKQNVNAIIYELHVRDFSIDKSSGVSAKNQGKYLAFTQTGTKTAGGSSTGIDYLKQLGITHVHILPTYDYGTGDETKEATTYNWGYDPVLYNNVEGMYATNPEGVTRQIEYKKMVQAIHNAGIGVIQDVVYNHTYKSGQDDPYSIFDKVVPGYYYRTKEDGSYSAGSGCSNDVATEKPMVRKFILDSVKYQMKEYHVDAFRFDIMGLIDTTTMKAAYKEIKSINPNAIVYGEGWLSDGTALPQSQRMVQKAVAGTDIAAFNDSWRNEVKGEDRGTSKGFVQGSKIDAKTIAPELKGETVWTKTANESINYTGSHDGAILWDKIAECNTKDSEADLTKRNNLANAMLMVSEGVPFFNCGTEFGRTKKATDGKEGFENSYDAVHGNEVDWTLADKNKSMVDYMKGLIALRKAHSAFTMSDRTMIDKSFEFAKTTPKGVIEYVIKDNANGDSWKNVLVIFNNNTTEKKLKVTGDWNIVVNDQKAGVGTLSTAKDEITVPALSAVVAYTNGSYTLDENSDPVVADPNAAKVLYWTVKAGDYTFKVTLPASTGNDDVYMVGGFNSWNQKGDPNYKLTKQADGTYTVSGALKPTDEFKFVRGTDWAMVEKKAVSDPTITDPDKANEVTNRKVGTDKEQNILIEKWKDLDGVATAADQANFGKAPVSSTATKAKMLVVKVGDVTLHVTIPATADAENLYMVGAFTSWTPGNSPKLVKQADGTYVADAKIPAGGEYKFVETTENWEGKKDAAGKFDWDGVEKQADDSEITNRKWDATTPVQSILIEKFKDKEDVITEADQKAVDSNLK